MNNNGRECYFLYNVFDADVEKNDISEGASISVTKCLRDTKTGEPYGILVINVNSSYYNKIYPKAIREDNTCYLLIDDMDGDVRSIAFSSGDKERMNDSIRKYVENQSLDSRYVVTKISNAKTDWTLVHITETAWLLSGNMIIFTLMSVSYTHLIRSIMMVL